MSTKPGELQVRSQKKGFIDKELDGLLVGNAVSAYIHMETSLRLFDIALERISNKEFKVVKRKYRTKLNRITDIRHRVAHPEEDRTKGVDKRNFLMMKRTGHSDDGTVRLREVALMKGSTVGRKIELTPRPDLEILRRYLLEAADSIRTEIETRLL